MNLVYKLGRVLVSSRNITSVKLPGCGSGMMGLPVTMTGVRMPVHFRFLLFPEMFFILSNLLGEMLLLFFFFFFFFLLESYETKTEKG